MINEIDIAYCAGLFDGEGCISVSDWTDERGYHRHHCSIVLGMQHLATIEFFQRTVGEGTVTRRGDGLWVFQAASAKAVRVVRVLAPFLRTKREAALLFMEFAATFSAKNRKPLPPEIVTTRRDLARRIHHVIHADARAAASYASNGGTN